jgi:hypothetical protein
VSGEVVTATPGRAACEAFWAAMGTGPQGQPHDAAWTWAQSQGAQAAWETAVLAGVDAILAAPGPQLAGITAALEIARLRAAVDARDSLAVRMAVQHEAMTQLRADHSEALAALTTERDEARKVAAEILHEAADYLPGPLMAEWRARLEKS